jgi:beta-N-acetylhexosaminidase
VSAAAPGRGRVAFLGRLAFVFAIVAIATAGGIAASVPPGPRAQAVVAPSPSAAGERDGRRPQPARLAAAVADEPPPAPTVEQLIGQKLVVKMEGTTPSAALLGRIGRGEIGGVVLYRSNITGRSQLALATRTLQEAATNGGQPRLLIMVDQEGAKIRNVLWAPPAMSAYWMGTLGLTATARSQGTLTGQALHGLGFNVDLAPVADVPISMASFMYLQRRTFSFSAATTSRLANAFAAGLRAEGVMPAFKHFPGIGRALRNTDHEPVTIMASAAALESDLLPFRAAIARNAPMIMLSNATYRAYDGANAAGWSRAVATDLLRTRLGFRGVSITDSLDGTAASRGVLVRLLAVKAAAAGTDMILVTGPEAGTVAVFDRLVREATAGSIPTDVLRSSYDRILALKSGL